MHIWPIVNLHATRGRHATAASAVGATTRLDIYCIAWCARTPRIGWCMTVSRTANSSDDGVWIRSRSSMTRPRSREDWAEGSAKGNHHTTTTRRSPRISRPSRSEALAALMVVLTLLAGSSTVAAAQSDAPIDVMNDDDPIGPPYYSGTITIDFRYHDARHDTHQNDRTGLVSAYDHAVDDTFNTVITVTRNQERATTSVHGARRAGPERVSLAGRVTSPLVSPIASTHHRVWRHTHTHRHGAELCRFCDSQKGHRCSQHFERAMADANVSVRSACTISSPYRAAVDAQVMS
jgi:hypothetical protein